ncbi:hypothetical protein BCR41DRAFT_402594 [Lobosporangium transversale]|uniref:Uncharacterized protein n=1 Tax=Lobosporangium transversale TaxID=64571 RepID=A0A1Y2G359_9FUNG|nr:hypothetical protein BCR41DRAFT_402594 [Lobosporangium transversale]ORY92386.1 hypothetical protein BCR41DRAFT_402594 [Lobosporangium transversale]|eukprot:XP_021875131.1 hypothetical protein BCR41DRAFT_402594 [Lobosporangium transversale]
MNDTIDDWFEISDPSQASNVRVAFRTFQTTSRKLVLPSHDKSSLVSEALNTSSVLKFQMSEYDTSDPIIHSLQSQLATLTSRLEALSTSSESSRSNPYLVPKEPAYEITPDDSILVHYPAMDGKDFFKHKSGNRADDLAYATEMAKEMQSFAKNTTQTYSAPKSALIDWPDSSSHHSSMDKTISRYQSRLANLTRPLDQFATEMFSYEVDPAVAQACLQLAQTMREHIARLAQQMSSDREDLVYQAHKISVTKDTVDPPIVSTSDFIEASKLAKSVRQATNPTRQRAYNRRTQNRSFFSANTYRPTSNSSQSHPSGQTQTAHYQNDNGSFFGRGQNPRRGGRGRGRGYQTPQSNQTSQAQTAGQQ